MPIVSQTVRRYALECDDCGKRPHDDSGLTYRWDSERDARAAATAAGYVHSGAWWFCPVCAAKEANRANG